MRPQDPLNFDSLNLVIELCEENLMDFIRGNRGQFEAGQVELITYEIIKGLVFIHSKGIIHRDLKSQNILITEEFAIKITDMGLSNVQNEIINRDYALTKYV